MLSHFDSSATTGAAGDFIKKYTEKYGKETLNQFGASAYDCVYAIYGAMKEAKVDDVTISASDLCDVLKDTFKTYKLKNAVTGGGSDVSWNKDGKVKKSAIKFVIKEADKA